MWPFKDKQKEIDIWKARCGELLMEVNELKSRETLSELRWIPLHNNMIPLCLMPPIKTNILVANIDFTYFGFLYMEDGWDQSKKINMQSKDKIWPCYTNPESISWWLNLDLIGK